MDSVWSKLRAATQRPDVRALFVLVLLIAVIVTIVYAVRATHGASQTVDQQIASARIALAQYDKNYSQRKSLTELIGTPSSRPADISSNALSLSNFYVATAYNCAVYGGPKGIVATDFIVSALRAGARCLDFLVLPADPTDPRSAPVVCDGNQNNRTRTTVNYISFDDACKTIHLNALEQGGTSLTGLKNAGDPLFIMLRIRSGQNKPMLQSIATTLHKYFSEYRLPYTYYKCARQTKMYGDPMDVFMGRVIFLTDSSQSGTPIDEYINAVLTPSSASVNTLQQTLWTDSQLSVLDTAGQQHLQSATEQALMMTVPATDGTSVIRTVSDAEGIQFTAVDIWKVAEIATQFKMFTTYSFALKPTALQYITPALPTPVQPGPQYNANNGIITLPGH